MIPILEAVSKVEHNLKGGQSKPWIVTVSDNKKLEEYVIKPFGEGRPVVGNYLNKELIASVLAQDFDIPTPEPALVHLNNGFFDTLNDADKDRIDKIRPRLVFGSKYYSEGFTDYPNHLSPSSAKYINTETVFAFDVLIRNFDRRKKKPNLMIDGSSYICIDHELSLDITRSFSDYSIWNDWISLKKPESFHLFFEYLKRKQEVDFLEFNEYFKTFNTKSLEQLKEFVHDCQLDTEEFDTTIYYFDNLIQNKSRFYELLNFLISK